MKCVRCCFCRFFWAIFAPAIMLMGAESGVLALAILLTGVSTRVHAQSVPPAITFEAATVKPRNLDFSQGIVMMGFRIYEARSSYSISLKSLFTYAFKLQPDQVSGPEWMDKDIFDIEARYPKGATKADEPKMLQALLKERFKLAFHIEKKEVEGYALAVGKHGVKLRPSSPDSPEAVADASPKPVEVNTTPKLTKNKDGSETIDLGNRGLQTSKFDMENWAVHYERGKITMGEFAQMLSGCLGGGWHTVDDQTAIKGDYQVAWDCPMGGHRPTTGGGTDALPSDPQGSGTLDKSLDALGLKLEKRKVLKDIYVIDYVEKPSGD